MYIHTMRMREYENTFSKVVVVYKCVFVKQSMHVQQVYCMKCASVRELKVYRALRFSKGELYKQLLTTNACVYTYRIYIMTPSDQMSQDLSYFSGPSTSGAT